MELHRIRDDIDLLIGDAYSSNCTIFLAGDEALLVDGMGSRADAAYLQQYVETDLGKRVRFLISTHYFSDHLAALERFPAATIVAHELYAQTFAGERFRSEEEASFFVEPSLTFSDRLSLRFGAHRLELFHNPGHTPSTIGIDVPSADLLFTGDTVVGNIAYIPYGTPALLESALERLRGRGRGQLIASHAGVRDAAPLGHALAYLRALTARPAPVDAPLEEFLPPGLVPSDFERHFHRRNLEHLAA